jgi:molybdate transport system substrate-binding protein
VYGRVRCFFSPQFGHLAKSGREFGKSKYILEHRKNDERFKPRAAISEFLKVEIDRDLHMNIRRVAWFVALLVSLATFVRAQDLTVAAAADLQSAMLEISSRFQKETGKTVKVIYGSSGNFLQQIQNGAPFDMFFSANLDYPKKLEAAGLTEADSFYEYAVGKIVVWVPNDSKLDIGSGLPSLLNPAVNKIAIANPLHAPYGQAAVAAMKKEGVYEKLQSKFVMGENISQTASFALSGSVDAGIIALSLALSPNLKDKGRFTEIPSKDYPPIEQGCVILKSSQHKEAAKAFLSFVKSGAIAELFRAYGFAVPGNTSPK